MNRRRVLSAIGISVAMSSFAGCTSSDDGSENEGDESEASSENGDEESSESVETEELIASAGASLREAVGEFEQTTADDPVEDGPFETDSDEDDEVPSIDTDRVETLIDDAEDDIETAREGATDEQLTTLDSLATVAEFLRDLVPVFSAVNEAMTNFDEGDRYLETDQLDAAADALERSEANLETAMDNVTIARATFEDIDPDGLETVDELDYAGVAEAFESFEADLEAVQVIATGTRQLIDGLSPLQAGNAALEEERFQTAAAEFEAASDQFYRAYTTFDEGAMNATGEHREDLLEFACEMEAFSDAMDQFARGSEAFADDNPQAAAEYFDAGERAMERCEDDHGAAMPAIR